MRFRPEHHYGRYGQLKQGRKGGSNFAHVSEESMVSNEREKVGGGSHSCQSARLHVGTVFKLLKHRFALPSTYSSEQVTLRVR